MTDQASLIEGLLGALDWNSGEGFVERYGPITVFVAFVALLVGLAIGYVPQSVTLTPAYLVLSGLFWFFIRHNFPEAPTPPAPPQPTPPATP